jgi:hypothetical protein
MGSSCRARDWRSPDFSQKGAFNEAIGSPTGKLYSQSGGGLRLAFFAAATCESHSQRRSNARVRFARGASEKRMQMQMPD